MTAVATPPEQRVDAERRVTPLELFFDLIFVLAITQVTAMLAHDPTWRGLLRGVLVLFALWFAWEPFAWLTTSVDPEEGATRLAMFGVMGAMLVAALAVPHAFGEDALAFGVAYACVRAGHIVLFAIVAQGDQRRAIWRLAPSMLGAGALLIVAALLHDSAREVVWVLAVAADVAGPYLAGVQGWRVSPGHFAERHGLIVLIAIGESIVSIGVGAAGLAVHGPLIVAALLGVAIAAAVWWCYFDVVAPVAERRLRRAPVDEQARIARDSYAYLHLPMVGGIILLALGIKKALPHLDDPLGDVPAACLCGGLAMYLLGLVGFRLRNVHSLNRRRLACAVILLALIPAVMHVPSLASLGILAALMCGLVAYEALRYAEARDRVRHAAR